MRNFLLFIFILAVSFSPKAQNHFANPGFEDLNICTELKASCAPEAWFYIRPTTNPLVRGRDVPTPATATNLLLVPVENVFSTPAKRSFVYTMLTCPLVKDEQYKLSFMLHTSARPFFHLDVLFLDTEPAATSIDFLKIAPSIRINSSHLFKTRSDWRAVEFIYTATGKEKFCLLGNLSAEKMAYSPEHRMSTHGQVYYFIDDLQLFPLRDLPPCPEEANNLKKIYGQNTRHTEGALVEKNIGAAIPRLVTDTITIPAALFETNSAVPEASFVQVMDSVLLLFSQKKIVNIEVNGHTDNRGKKDHNELLSKARAEAVKTYILKVLPQYQDLISTYGHADTMPVASNDSEAGRRMNRRVEIILTCMEKADQPN